jgi:hypothetical protein
MIQTIIRKNLKHLDETNFRSEPLIVMNHINISMEAYENRSFQFGCREHIKMFVEADIFEKLKNRKVATNYSGDVSNFIDLCQCVIVF